MNMNKMMKKNYLKPEMEISNLGVSELLGPPSASGGTTGTAGSKEFSADDFSSSNDEMKSTWVDED